MHTVPIPDRPTVQAIVDAEHDVIHLHVPGQANPIVSLSFAEAEDLVDALVEILALYQPPEVPLSDPFLDAVAAAGRIAQRLGGAS